LIWIPGPVWYSDAWFVSGCRIVRYSNGIQIPDKFGWFFNSPVFRKSL
jgi:hypothetical protein